MTATAQEAGNGPALQARFIGTQADCERAVQVLRAAGFDLPNVRPAKDCDTIDAVMIYAYPPHVPPRRIRQERPRDRRGR